MKQETNYFLIPVPAVSDQDTPYNHQVLDKYSQSLRSAFPEMNCCVIFVKGKNREEMFESLYQDVEKLNNTLASIDYTTNAQSGVQQGLYFTKQQQIVNGLLDGFLANIDGGTMLSHEQTQKLANTAKEKFKTPVKFKPKDVVLVPSSYVPL